MKSHQLESASGLLPAELLPVDGFLSPAVAVATTGPLQDLIVRITSGTRAHLEVPLPLIYRWACLAGRFSAELQAFIANVLRNTGNVDHFIVRPAAHDHHAHDHGLLESSIQAAEFALNPDHRADLWESLPAVSSDLDQVCAALAFLFDLCKVYVPEPALDRPRLAQADFAPHTDLPRCWRNAWRELHRHNPVLASWLHHVARVGPHSTAEVRAAHARVRRAVTTAWDDGR